MGAILAINGDYYGSQEEGYVLRANTYGTIRVERGIAKKGGVRAAVCPSCGMLVLRMERE